MIRGQPRSRAASPQNTSADAGPVIVSGHRARPAGPLAPGPAVAGVVVFATNVNVLYQQSTSTDELPFYAFTIAAVYYLVKWGETRRSTNLLAASVCSMLATLCRYEGWFLSGVYVICVIAMGWPVRVKSTETQGSAAA